MYELEPLESRVLLSHTGWLLGDANHDGVVNTDDAQLIMNAFPGTKQEIKRLDLSGDGKLTGFDASLAVWLGEGVPLSLPNGILYPTLEWQHIAQKTAHLRSYPV